MAKNSIDAYGASGKSNVLFFEPESLHLVTDTTHPLYDERVHLPLNEAVILNIMELGVLEPIIVWKDPETGKTCVVAGRQRVKNAMEANARRKRAGLEPWPVPGIAKRGSAIQMAKYMVSENEITQPDTPLGRAKKMVQQMEYGHDENDIALLFGCSVKTVQAPWLYWMLRRPSRRRLRLEKSLSLKRVSWSICHRKSSGKRSNS